MNEAKCEKVETERRKNTLEIDGRRTEELETAEKFISERYQEDKRHNCGKGAVGTRKTKHILCKICERTIGNKFRTKYEEAR